MVALLFLILIVPAAQAKLSDILAIYAQRSPELQVVEQRTAGASSMAAASQSFDAPQLGLEWGSSGNGMYYTGIQIQQMLPAPGKRGARKTEADGMLRMARAEKDQQIRSGYWSIGKAYVELYMLRRRLEWNDSARKTLNELAVIVEQSYGARREGAATMSLLDARKAKLRGDSATMAGEIIAMQAMLEALAGDSSARMAIPAKIAFSDSLALMVSGTEGLIAKRADIQAMDAARAAAAGARDGARLLRWPDAMIGAKYMAMMGPDEWSLMVGASLPFVPWASGETQAMAASAEARYRESDARYHAMIRMASGEARSAYERMQATRSKYLAIRDNILPSVQRAVEANLREYGAGMGNLARGFDARDMQWMNQDDATMAEGAWLLSAIEYAYSAGWENPAAILVETE